MGGVSEAVSVGTGVTSMISSRNAQKDEMNNIRKQQQSAVNNRKNLLDQQLASRRAMLGAMGVSMDGSNQSGQQKIIDEGYEDIYDTNYQYDNRYKKAYDDYHSSLYSGIGGLTSKVLK